MTSVVQHDLAVEETVALDTAVRELRAGLGGWLGTSLAERIGLLRSVRCRTVDEAPAMVAAVARAQGIALDGQWAGEPWATLVTMVQWPRAWETVLGRLADGREPLPASAVRTRPDGQVVVDVFPATWRERALFGAYGYRTEVWMQPGTTAEEVRAGAARAYRGNGFERPGVALALGAGNVGSLVGTDLLHLLYGQGCVVLMKLNPVNAYLRAPMERIFADFVERGWVRFVDGGAAEGAYLAHHPGIDRLHMTGSRATYETLVWGPGPEQARNRASGRRLLDKPFTCELGGVGPVVVVPGDWTQGQLRRQADRIVYAKTVGCGHICASPQVLVLPDRWPQGTALLEEIRRLLGSLEPREPYYPGTAVKVAGVLQDAPRVESLQPPDRQLLVTGLRPADRPRLFRDEVFADVLGVVRLPAPSVESYLEAATAFANEQLAGDLAATVLVDPATARRHRPALDRAVAGLRYGAVGVNEWALLAIQFGYGTWGGYPGHDPRDVGSGIGVVGNAFLLERPQKTVMRARFSPPVKPMTSVTYRTARSASAAIISYLGTGNPRYLARLLAAAARA
jgi:acyl-CoA reductase-like NAD-dependent aldehyde dehydrogenase